MRQQLIGLAAAVVMMTGVSTAAAQDSPGTPATASDSRLFFGATARSLPAGHAYFSLREMSIPAFQVGVTDRFSIGAGTPLVIAGKVMFFTPKYEVYRGPTTSVAAGMLHIAVVGKGGLNVAYGVATTGNDDNSLTAGVGVATASFDGGGGHALVGMIGGEHRISNRAVFVTENYVLRGAVVVSGGVRVYRGRFSSDLGFMMPMAAGIFGPPTPVINFAWRL